MVRLDQVSPELNEADRRASAVELLASFGLQDIADTPATLLSAGQRKLVDIVRAAAGSPPILLLDEPAVGLTPTELKELEKLLLSLRSQGCGIVLVEHNMDFVSRIADKGVVLHGGVLIATGPIETILNNEKVRSAYLGAIR
jgi:branched-chain amino acid transport system permease protein